MSKPFIVAINAITGGGKTTVTRALRDTVANSAALFFDDRDYDSDSGIEDTYEWIMSGADCNLFDLQRLADDISSLIHKGYDYFFLDYPFGYRHRQIGPFVDCSVYIDTPLDVALARRVIRDFSAAMATEILDELNGYLDARKAYLYGLNDRIKEADLVVDGSLPVEDVVKKIREHIDGRIK